MSRRDADNLAFLLNLTPTGLREWYEQASEDDINYAEELIAQAQILAIDARVAGMPQYVEAKEVLKPFLL